MKARLDSGATTLAAGSILVTAFFVALAACSASGDAPSTVPAEDGGSVLPSGDDTPDDGAPDDAGPDVTDAAQPLCSVDGFCHTSVPEGKDLISVWGDGEGLVWAVSYSGDVLCWDGAKWALRHRTGVLTYAIWGSGPTDLWIGTETGLVHGHGASPAALVFEPIDAPGDPTIAIKSIWGTGPDDVWAVGGAEHLDLVPSVTKGRVLHLARTDAGSAWTSQEDLASTKIAFRSVWGSAKTGVWIQGVRPDDEPDGSSTNFPHAHVLRRPTAATTWTSVALPRAPQGTTGTPFASHIFGANTIADTSVWLAGILGVLDRGSWRGTSTDGGESFTWTFTGGTRWDRMPFAYWGTAPDDTWAVGETGLVSHWDGTTWKQAIIRTSSVPITKHLRAVWGKDSSDFWIVGHETALHRIGTGKP